MHYFPLPETQEIRELFQNYHNICKLAQQELDKHINIKDWKTFAKAVDNKLYCQSIVFNSRKEGHDDIRYVI
jgi:hypothetical protein